MEYPIIPEHRQAELEGSLGLTGHPVQLVKKLQAVRNSVSKKQGREKLRKKSAFISGLNTNTHVHACTHKHMPCNSIYLYVCHIKIPDDHNVYLPPVGGNKKLFNFLFKANKSGWPGKSRPFLFDVHN